MDDMDFTKAPAPSVPIRSKFYDPVMTMKVFKALGKVERVARNGTFFVEHEKGSKFGFMTGGQKMFLLVSGQVVLTAGAKIVDTVKVGEIFGEMALISQAPRSATATAKTDCEALSLDDGQFQSAIQQSPEFALMMMSAIFDRLRMVAAKLVVRKNAPAQTTTREAAVFDSRMLANLQQQLEGAATVRYLQEKVIMHEGQKGASMYVVLEGRVGIWIGNTIVESIGPGGTFGEMALVDQSPRTASAVAQTECALLSINRAALMALVKAQPAFGVALLRAVADRLRYMNSLVA
jgi:CRP/FNR family transcriptional regulator, cyclic AMP receptor protein